MSTRRHLLPLLVVVAASLSACSGSLYIGYDGSSGSSPDTRPTVTLAASADLVIQAGTINLVAAAADDHGISDVRFYALEGNIPNLIGTISSAPYRLPVSLSRANNGPVYFFARARDSANQTADSPTVTVTVAIP